MEFKIVLVILILGIASINHCNAHYYTVKSNRIRNWLEALQNIIGFKINRKIDDSETLMHHAINVTEIEQEWAAQTGPAYALKLINLVGYDSRLSHQVFSPFAFKLNLLALASIEENHAHVHAINRFLFNRTSFYLDDHELDKMSYTRMRQLKSRVESFNPEIVPPKTPDEVSPGYSISDYWNAFQSTAAFLYYRYSASWIDPVTNNQPDNRIPQVIYDLCSPFKYNLLHTLNDCVKYLKMTKISNLEKQISLYSRFEKLKLCHEFNIANYEDCLQLTSDGLSGRKSLEHKEYTNEDVAWHLVNEFLNKENQTTFIMKQVLFPKSDTNLIQSSDDMAHRMLNWFNVHQFESKANKTLLQKLRLSLKGDWNVYKKHLQTNIFSDRITFPTVQADLFLSLIAIDSQWMESSKSLVIRKQFFSGPSGKRLIDMLNGFGNYGRVYHITNEGKHFHTLIRIPLKSNSNEKFSMVIMMPDVESNITQMMSSLTGNQLSHYLRRLHTEKCSIRLSIPQFSFLNGEYDLSSIVSKHNLSSNLAVANFRQHIHVIQRSSNSDKDHKEEFVHEPLDQLDLSQFFSHSTQSDSYVSIDRPFVYLLVGKYIDLRRRPAFEIMLAGYYNGPQ